MQQQRGFLGAFFILLVIASMMALGFYMARLDAQMISTFSGKAWNVPSRVYSRPLILEGAGDIGHSDVIHWLEALHYEAVNDRPTVGQYSASKQRIEVAPRAFEGGKVPAPFVLEFKNGMLHKAPQDAYLPPILLGKIFPNANEDRIMLDIKGRVCTDLMEAHDAFDTLIQALIATEDRNFCTHYGISARGTARALVNNLQGKSLQGGSTLTQQLIKNFSKDHTRSYERKINEALMSLLLERRFSKEDILFMYVNEVNLGQHGDRAVSGFGLASMFYFGKPLSELKTHEIALLVGIGKGPSYYNPRKHPKRAIQRRNVVLHSMAHVGHITQNEAQTLSQMPLEVLETPSTFAPTFPAFLDAVKREFDTRYIAGQNHARFGKEGLTILTTLDPLAQIAAEEAVQKELKTLRRGKAKSIEAALVSSELKTGALVAIVGSGSEFQGFNRALDAKRQVGSLLKPWVYLLALASDEYSWESVVPDTPITIDGWSPKNYSGTTHGSVSMLKALTHSYNLPVVHLGERFGVGLFKDTLAMFGVLMQDDTDDLRTAAHVPLVPSLYLGSAEMSPLNVLTLYQSLGARGVYNAPYVIDSIWQNGVPISRYQAQGTPIAVKDAHLYLLNYGLMQVAQEGTAKKAAGMGIAGKTGTTNDNKDAWFAGYNGRYATVVWVGRDDNKPMGLTGGQGALPIWMRYMRHLPKHPIKWQMPQGVEMAQLVADDGGRAGPGCYGVERPVSVAFSKVTECIVQPLIMPLPQILMPIEVSDDDAPWPIDIEPTPEYNEAHEVFDEL